MFDTFVGIEDGGGGAEDDATMMDVSPDTFKRVVMMGGLPEQFTAISPLQLLELEGHAPDKSGRFTPDQPRRRMQASEPMNGSVDQGWGDGSNDDGLSNFERELFAMSPQVELQSVSVYVPAAEHSRYVAPLNSRSELVPIGCMPFPCTGSKRCAESTPEMKAAPSVFIPPHAPVTPASPKAVASSPLHESGRHNAERSPLAFNRAQNHNSAGVARTLDQTPASVTHSPERVPSPRFDPSPTNINKSPHANAEYTPPEYGRGRGLRRLHHAGRETAPEYRGARQSNFPILSPHDQKPPLQEREPNVSAKQAFNVLPSEPALKAQSELSAEPPVNPKVRTMPTPKVKEEPERPPISPHQVLPPPRSHIAATEAAPLHAEMAEQAREHIGRANAASPTRYSHENEVRQKESPQVPPQVPPQVEAASQAPKQRQSQSQSVNMAFAFLERKLMIVNMERDKIKGALNKMGPSAGRTKRSIDEKKRLETRLAFLDKQKMACARQLRSAPQ